MMSKFKFDQLSERHLWLLSNSAVGILPTDTIYGVVTQVNNKESVKRLYSLKNRKHKPGTIIASNTRQLIDMGVEPRYITMASRFWLNPISVIMPVGDLLSYVHQGLDSLAFRVVADPELAMLLDITGPLLTSSANKPGEPVANTVGDAMGYFGDTVDFYIDGGDLSGILPSTIVRVDDAGTEILREGSIKVL